MNTQVEYSILCYCYSDLKPLMIRIPVFGDTVDDTILSRHLGRPGSPALPGRGTVTEAIFAYIIFISKNERAKPTRPPSLRILEKIGGIEFFKRHTKIQRHSAV